MVGQQNVDWQNRAHFFGVAASIMRHLLVDHARANGRVRRGGNPHKVTLEEGAVVSEQKGEELLALDEALTKLNEIDERKVKIVELRYFGGLTEVEAAETLQISIATLKRDWDFARTWLASELGG